jgi:hypothetical protein
MTITVPMTAARANGKRKMCVPKTRRSEAASPMRRPLVGRSRTRRVAPTTIAKRPIAAMKLRKPQWVRVVHTKGRARRPRRGLFFIPRKRTESPAGRRRSRRTLDIFAANTIGMKSARRAPRPCIVQ